jgi:hypothetical protein
MKKTKHKFPECYCYRILKKWRENNEYMTYIMTLIYFSIFIFILHGIATLDGWAQLFQCSNICEFRSATGLEIGLLNYRTRLLYADSRPKTRTDFLSGLQDFYKVRQKSAFLPEFRYDRFFLLSESESLRGQSGE